MQMSRVADCAEFTDWSKRKRVRLECEIVLIFGWGLQML